MINIQRIKKLIESESGVNALWLYGSQADNTAQTHSDFDLAVQFHDFVKDEETRLLRPHLLKIDICSALKCSENTISIVDLESSPTALAWEILSSAKLLFCKNDSKRMFLECRIYSQYELDVEYHRKLYG
jgi:predicted nucleotidyltransferase